MGQIYDDVNDRNEGQRAFTPGVTNNWNSQVSGSRRISTDDRKFYVMQDDGTANTGQDDQKIRYKADNKQKAEEWINASSELNKSIFVILEVAKVYELKVTWA